MAGLIQSITTYYSNTFIQSSFTCPQRQVCACLLLKLRQAPGLEMLGVRKTSWGHISQLIVCRGGREGDRLPGSPAEQPLKDSFRGYSFPLTHCEKRTFSKYCNANRAQSVLLSYMNMEGVAYQWTRKQGSASHLPMTCSMALGSLLCWPAAARMLLVATWDAGKDTAPCTRLGFSLRATEIAWSWDMIPGWRSQLVLWILKCYCGSKTISLLALCVLHCNLWTSSLQSPFVQSKTMCAVNMTPWGESMSSHTAQLSPPVGTSQEKQLLKTPIV